MNAPNLWGANSTTGWNFCALQSIWFRARPLSWHSRQTGRRSVPRRIGEFWSGRVGGSFPVRALALRAMRAMRSPNGPGVPP